MAQSENDEIRVTFKELGIEIAPFHPHLIADKVNNSLTYHEKDCSVTEEQVPGSNIVVFRDNDTGQVVGVRIENISELVRFEQ